jgi:predicted ATPase
MTFIGRQEEMTRLDELCAARTPIVTLWGPPGIGKTRLALELCRRVERGWFCDLAAARDAADVREALALRLGMASPASGLAAALAGLGPGVIVLDNFEQVAASAAETVGAWKAGGISFVVTTRERLRLSNEVEVEVPPLAERDAALLFQERAGQRGRLDEVRVRELVRRLEGIPLAIELAAARVDVLGLEGVLARVDQPFLLLAHGARDRSPHHATLRQAIASSFRLLSPAEKGALACCSLFRGGFSLDAAEAVIVADDGSSVLDLLQSLRDKSLLRRRSDGDAVRFTLFDAGGPTPRGSSRRTPSRPPRPAAGTPGTSSGPPAPWSRPTTPTWPRPPATP